MLGARALVVEARAHLCRMPVDARHAARLSVRALRIARAAELPEPAAEATEALRRSLEARRKRPPLAERRPMKYSPVVTDGSLWGYLDAVASGATRADAARQLTRAIATQSGAERVLVVALDASFGVTWAAGTDLDGLDLADPANRVDRDSLASAAATDGITYQRDIETRGGRGCRLVATKEVEGGARAAVVAEHRFAPGAFDAVSRPVAMEWAVLAALALFRTSSAGGREAAGAGADEAASIIDGERAPSSEPSTAIPRSRTRTFPEIVGTSDALKRALDRLDAAIDSDLPVLVQGETGSGKELFARALHEHGARRKGPFVAVNCGAIHDALFEAELFGHAKGGFTGAERSRTGLIASAERGVLFLDEIGELPLARQASLLRVLATHRYRPVGSDEERSFDVRIVAATNRDLEQESLAGKFRKDLLYRLNVLEVFVPPLRKRAEDIVMLAKRFLSEHGSESVLSTEAARALEAYGWPGNVRELEHQMQRLAALGVSRVEPRHLSREIRSVVASISAKKAKSAGKTRVSVAESSADGERRQVQSALRAAQGNITRAADALSMTRQGLKKKMVRLGLREPSALVQGRTK
jgi:DNA-binding NtrC family response regulator